jgi:hypothetical protein
MKMPERSLLKSSLVTLIDDLDHGQFTNSKSYIVMKTDYTLTCALDVPMAGLDKDDSILTKVRTKYNAYYSALFSLKEIGKGSEDPEVHLLTDLFAEEAVDMLLKRAAVKENLQRTPSLEEEKPLKCPMSNCDFSNPLDAIQCECGYEFVKETPLYFDNPLWKIPVSWRARYNFNGVKKDCSKSMKDALRSALDNNNTCSSDKPTLDILISKQLCDNEMALTPQGRIIAISISSLTKQADILSIPINKLELSYNKPPELYVMKYLKDCNFKHVCFTEGGIILTLLFCMCSDEIYKYWKLHPLCKEYGNDYAKSYMYMGISSYLKPLEETPQLHEYLLNRISKANENDITKAFNKLKSWHKDMGLGEDEWPFKDWYGLNLEILLTSYRLLTNAKLVGIAETYFNDPYVFCKGWADLLAIDKDNQIMQIEVKTSDKLIISQVINLESMKNYIPTFIFELKKPNTKLKT